jgi:hypothetical protein
VLKVCSIVREGLRNITDKKGPKGTGRNLAATYFLEATVAVAARQALPLAVIR